MTAPASDCRYCCFGSHWRRVRTGSHRRRRRGHHLKAMCRCPAAGSFAAGLLSWGLFLETSTPNHWLYYSARDHCLLPPLSPPRTFRGPAIVRCLRRSSALRPAASGPAASCSRPPSTGWAYRRRIRGLPASPATVVGHLKNSFVFFWLYINEI